MSRRVHYLQANESNESPANVIWFDTETLHNIGTDGRQYHYLRFGYAAFQRKYAPGKWTEPQWLRFTTLDSFWSWVIAKTRPKTRLYLMSHNGAFDLPVMHAFTKLPERGFKLLSAIADAPPLVLVWKRETSTIKFVDTLNIWRMPLKNLGESIGVPKLKMPAPNASKAKWDKYGKNDVEIIRLACQQWFEFLVDNDLGGFAPTLASQAFRAYRHRFMPCPILIDDNQDAQKLARASYLGGRVECFRLGEYEGEFYYVDFNSMYPAVMKEGLFPVRLLGVYGAPTFAELRKWLSHRCVICEVDLNTDEPVYPIVHDGRLVFPVGRFRAVLSSPELAYALDHGHIENALRASVYLQEHLFAGFVDFMHGERMRARAAGDQANDHNFKIMDNSLYGKFGQRGRQYEDMGECDPDEIMVWSEVDAETDEVRHYRAFGGLVQCWQDEGESRDSFPAIASHVCSMGRMKLWEAYQLAGREHCYYCDTDSLVVDQAGYDNLEHLVDPNALGALALERHLTKINIRGPKDYTFDGDTKVKGVRKTAEWLAEDLVRQDYFVGFKGLLREGSLDAPIVTKIQKKLKRIYTKGDVQSDGTVLPLRFNGSG